MKLEEIKENLISIMEEELETSYNRETIFDQELIGLNINSVAFIKLLVRLEVFFDVEFGEEIVLINKHTTVNDMVTFIKNKQNS
ncbi:MAG: phosphopantetheine-binding protein [Clostridia bacterium]|nr:phosphopantetheine-binding protein [Clostridia bacterium]